MDEIIWKDRRRRLGLPLSFTKYYIQDGRLMVSKGFFRSQTDEILLYRIKDISLSRTLGQKLVGVGTITLHTSDASDPTFLIKNVKKSKKVRTLLSKLIESERERRGFQLREGGYSGGHDGYPDHDIDGDGHPDY